MGRFRVAHVNCKDPFCLTHVPIEEWEEHGTCCGYCGCCPCGSWLCWECRGEKIPFKWWHSLTWRLWGHRKWDKYLKSMEKNQ